MFFICGGADWNSHIWKLKRPITKTLSIPALELAFLVLQLIAPPLIKITLLTDELIAKLEKTENAKASVSSTTLADINKAKSDRIAAIQSSSASVSQSNNIKETPDKLKDEKLNNELSLLTKNSVDEYISTRNIPQLIKFKNTAGIPGVKPDQLNPD